VGPFYEAQDQNCVNVFEDLPQGTGFCLALLGASEEQSISKRIRVKIRYGLQLTREPDGVWLYNRSNHVLFTWSPSLQLEATGEHTGQQLDGIQLQQTPPQVKRVPIGCSIKVFDRSQIPELSRAKLIDTTSRLPSNAPTFKRFNIRISFAKGWGTGYRRTFITQCPCWIECFLNDQMVM
jgi:MAD (mothers against decapentaplegic) family protein 6/7